jgi:hypothetical protein
MLAEEKAASPGGIYRKRKEEKRRALCGSRA